MYKYTIILLLFVVASCSTKSDRIQEKIIGVKIYDHQGDFQELFDTWKEVGINTVFASTTLLSNEEFRSLSTTYGIKTFAILPIFYAPEDLDKDSSLYSITNEGLFAEAEWVKFACPSNKVFRRKKIDFITDFVDQSHPDVISLDFIRHFTYWEKVYPEMPSDALPNTCFDSRCLHAFQEETGFTIPSNLKNTPEIFSWITRNHFEDWVRWKSNLITTMVEEIVTEVKKVDKDVQVNIHAVPWRQSDYDGAILSVVGQDFSALSAYTDYLSPMTYSHMVKRKPEWIHSVVKDIAGESSSKILPSIQVEIAYLTDTFSTDEFKKCIDASLKTPSVGVVFWNWDALFDNKEKLEIVKKYDF
jgi:hypothetical protein